MAYQPKSYRKFLATGVATAMVATAVAPAVSADQHTNFTDIEDVRSWAGDAIDYLVEKGAIQGMGTPGIFNPQGNLTRGQAASLLANTLGLDVDEDATSGFDDLEGHWSDAYVAAIQAELPGVIDGYTDGTFRPENNITRQEMAKITVEAFDLSLNTNAITNFSDNNGWGAEYVETLASLGILGGYTDGTIRPENDITRAEAAVFVHRTEVESVRLDVELDISAETGVAGFITLPGQTDNSGIKVEVNGYETETNRNGYFELESVSPGTYDLKASKTGYASYEESVVVEADQASAVVEELSTLSAANIVLNATAIDSFSGAALDSADVKLEVFNTNLDRWVTLDETTTNASGVFEFDQTDVNDDFDFGKEYRVTLSNAYADNPTEAYFEETREIELATDREENTLEGFQLDPVAEMELSVAVETSAEDDVADGTQVELFDTDGTPLAQFGTTDGEIEEDLTLPSGEYGIRVNDGIDAVYTGILSVTEGEDLSYEIELVEGNDFEFNLATETVGSTFGSDTATDITAKVVDGNGVVVGEVTETNTAIGQVDFDFDAAGISIADGSYTVEVEGDHIHPIERSVTINENNETASARTNPAGVITGTITNSDDNSDLQYATVTLLDDDGELVEEVETDADGEYSFVSLPAGDYEVVVDRYGFESDDSEVELEVRETETEDFALDPVDDNADLGGFVRTSGSLQPVDGATVSLYAVNVEDFEPGDFVDEEATTGATGQYNFTDIDAGRYNVVVRDAGGHVTVSQEVTITGGQDIENFNFTPQTDTDTELTISFVDEAGRDLEIGVDAVTVTDAYFDRDFMGAQEGQQEGPTAASNEVTFDTIASGNYELDIDAPNGYADIDEYEVTLTRGQDNELELVIEIAAPTFAVNVKVEDEDEDAVDEAVVAVFDADGDYVRNVTTNAQGELSGFELATGDYTLKVYKSGFFVATQEISVNNRALNVPTITMMER